MSSMEAIFRICWHQGPPQGDIGLYIEYFQPYLNYYQSETKCRQNEKLRVSVMFPGGFAAGAIFVYGVNQLSGMYNCGCIDQEN